MTTKPRPCQAENPGLCPYHGAQAQIDAASALLAESAASGDYNLFLEAREAIRAGEKRLAEAYELQDELGTKRIKTERADPPAIDGAWLREWQDSEGKPHRDGDKPARISYDGTREWFQHGELHREDGKPAVENKDGSRAWYKDGKLHREDAPAVMRPDGTESWYKNGELHRDGDQPAVVAADGTQEYYRNGKLHRDGDKPARVLPGRRLFSWLQDGKPAREGGKPHVLRQGLNGNRMAGWYGEDGFEERVEGITEEQFKAWGGTP